MGVMVLRLALAVGLLRHVLGCTSINMTGILVQSSGDIHPFDNDISTTAGAFGQQTCESVDEIFDDDIKTKWVETFGNDTYVQFQMQSIPCTTKYAFTSGNDFEGRDPSSWTFSGSNDGSTWEVLDQESGVEFSKRRETLEFPIAFSRHYQWYRIDFLGVRDADSGGGLIQLSDLSLFTGDCADHDEIWFSSPNRIVANRFHTIDSDVTSFLTLAECKDLCVNHNVSAEYYRDYQCSAITYRSTWRQYGVDHSSECNLIQYWGEAQLEPSTDFTMYTRDLGDCHDGVQLEESCYRLSEDVEGTVAWETASQECAAWGGYLAVFEDSEEAATIADIVRPKGDVARWVGLSTVGDCSANYHWSNYAQVDMSADFLQFVTTTDDLENDAHCVSMHDNANKYYGKKFDDRSCDEEYMFICEKDMPPDEEEDLNQFTCPSHTVCNGVGQYVVTAGNWANDTVCGCSTGFVSTGQGNECQCADGTYLEQIEGTTGSLNKYCATPRTCNKWGQYVVSESTPTSDVVCGCLSNATSCDPNA